MTENNGEVDVNQIAAVPPQAPPLPPRDEPVVAVHVEDDVEDVPTQEPAAGIPTDLAAQSYGSEAVDTGASSTSFEAETACVGGILVASCVELAQAAQNCNDKLNKCKEEDGYAVAVGTISLILCLCYFLCLKFKRELIGNFTQYLSLFFVLWWSVGAIVLTFRNPFITTGNGYFACWGALLLSIYYCQLAVQKLKTFGNRISNAISGSQQRKLLMLIMFLSYVEAFASLVLWDEVNGTAKKQSKQEVWAFACGIVAGGLATIYLLLLISKPNLLGSAAYLKYFSWFLVPWWMMGAGVATFDQPFPTTGNGYFCAWGAFVASCYLAYITTMTVTA